MSDPVSDALRQVHHEVVESRNLLIKTDNAVRSLESDLKGIGRRQDGWERRQLANSAVAYVLFAVTTFGGLYLFFQASIERAEARSTAGQDRIRQLEQRVTELGAELQRRREAEAESWVFYELLASGRRDEAVERFGSIQGRLTDRAMIELFRGQVDRLRHELAQETFRQGVQHISKENWQEARDSFSRSIAYVERAPYTTELHFNLGLALYRLGDWAGAIRYFELATEAGTMSRNQSVLASFHRAEALERSGRDTDAAEAYRSFARRFSTHPWSSAAESRTSSIQKRLESQRKAATEAGPPP